MNLSFLFIFIIISIIIIDFLTFKKEEEIIIKNSKCKRITKSFISVCITYLTFTLIFSLFIKYFLVPEEYFICNNDCSVPINNTFIGIVALIFQILSIYNFYDNYIYSYRFFTIYSKIYDKILIALLGLIAIIFNEFFLSNINLLILNFDIPLSRILIGIIIYSSYIFIPLLIIVREIYRIINAIESEEF